MQNIKQKIENKKILIVGGTGSWGSELVRQLVTDYNPAEIRVFSRGEHKQVELRHAYMHNPTLKFIIGDIRDSEAVDTAMTNTDIVFNLAALKHVPICEENVWEAIKTNVHGVHNIVNSAIKHSVNMVVQVSTDKAVDPLNLYGFTKGCAEKLITSANYSPARLKTTFVCVRAGNVLSTAGSVIPLFKYLIKNHNKVTITDKDMSRYIMRLTEAIQLVLKATAESIGGEIFVMKMPGIKITDLASVMINKLGNKNTRIEYIGIRPGEKMYEVLVSKNESPRTIQDGQYHIILPSLPDKRIEEHYKTYKKIDFEEYNSRNTNQLDKKNILQLLEKDGWLGKEKDDPLSSVLYNTVLV